jgi:hypothetical protein
LCSWLGLRQLGSDCVSLYCDLLALDTEHICGALRFYTHMQAPSDRQHAVVETAIPNVANTGARIRMYVLEVTKSERTYGNSGGGARKWWRCTECVRAVGDDRRVGE